VVAAGVGVFEVLNLAVHVSDSCIGLSICLLYTCG
jgi:hypothetical protein